MAVKRKILVVDDAPLFRELGELFLSRSGSVSTASCGAEALEAMWREPPDLLVTDLHMPGMEGDTLCRQLKADPNLGHIPVIVLTAGKSADERERAVRAGADDVIAKPIRRISLIQAVNRFLRATPLQGLPRVPVETSVQLQQERGEALAKARNLSRGGIFVEADRSLPPQTELGLRFQLPDAPGPLASTARVIWQRRSCTEAPAGMGLQFLALDRWDAQRIESFVQDHASAPVEPGVPESAAAS